MVQLTVEPIDIAALVSATQSPSAGAIVTFIGITREFSNGRQTLWLDYEAYGKMAEQEMEKLVSVARDRWPLSDVQLVHRLGRVPLAEASVAIVVAASHRAAAFEASQWLIDTLKEEVPIWKQEHWSDGSSEWVHPNRGQDNR